VTKGVSSAPSQALLSSKKVSAKKPAGQFKLEKHPLEVSESRLNLASSVPEHITVLLDEAVRVLSIKVDGIYVDGTFGRGGHSRKILSQLGPHGRLIAFDRDLTAIAAGKVIQDSRFSLIHDHFASMQARLAEIGISAVDGILLDLGISSPQIDEAERGFSFRFDAPLDLRMDQSGGQTAAEFLSRTTEQQLAEVIKNYGEERFAKSIARAIIKERDDGRIIATTGQLAQIVAGAVPRYEHGQNPATRTFQALRIFINQELEELSLTLPQCLNLLKPQARLAVISFHSLEDRMVKQFVRDQENRDDLPANFPVRAADLPQPRLVSVGKAIKPSAAEKAVNPRARSAVMRVAERTSVQ